MRSQTQCGHRAIWNKELGGLNIGKQPGMDLKVITGRARDNAATPASAQMPFPLCLQMLVCSLHASLCHLLVKLQNV